jgi:hypothetical protein
MVASPVKVAFQTPTYPDRNRRLSAVSTSSTDNSGGSSQAHEVFEQDWTTTTADKDTWAARERRRSNIFNGHTETYPSIVQAKPSSPSSPSFLETSPRERRGSILSLWVAGKDKDGQAVLHSDDHGDWVEEVKEADKLKDVSETKEEAYRKGSILSLWKKGKDENGKNIILSGEHEEDLILRQQKEEEAARARSERIAKLKKQMDALQMELAAEEREHAQSRDISTSA